MRQRFEALVLNHFYVSKTKLYVEAYSRYSLVVKY